MTAAKAPQKNVTTQQIRSKVGLQRNTEMQCTETVAKVTTIYQNEEDQSYDTLQQVSQVDYKSATKTGEHTLAVKDRPHTPS